MKHILSSWAAASLTGSLLALPSMAQAEEAVINVRQMTTETALRAAQAALDDCRARGFQIGVAVVDRNGLLQAFLRDRFAGAHTVDVALDKAWTSASFRMTTMQLGEETAAGRPASGIRQVARVVAMGGGVPIDAAGSHVGAIGVSGAPGGDADEACAQAGIAAISDDLAF